MGDCSTAQQRQSTELSSLKDIIEANVVFVVLIF